ncbi:Putative E3 ubiquitin-protein ligase LIN [Seminavis robusta]|uniref:E3 ubiquitin-protein ligase LIN n=1 Tax=Seminavis robusta TaxID=568900 RepID=A0A9N8HSF6_9STRA|nr:Putative E3 ubiquitin-protein ligase LIN [Seminavis robusta]|eukprot:Sro1379_g267710.1 Putative E3 ubiquitin-protein ligase LIN (182) ;mRNA; r:16502-17047
MPMVDAMEDLQRKVIPPSRFVCPITLEVMVHPVRAPGGRCFERWAILEWLYFGNDLNGGTHPLTRKPLYPQDLKEEEELRHEIETWRLQHGIPKPPSPYNQYDDDETEEDLSQSSLLSCTQEQAEEHPTLAASLQIIAQSSTEEGSCGYYLLPPRLLKIRNRILQSRDARCQLQQASNAAE